MTRCRGASRCVAVTILVVTPILGMSVGNFSGEPRVEVRLAEIAHCLRLA
jgi:hypothetical protein